MHTAYVIFAGILGAILGSFLNVVAHRVPRGESIVTPGSRCPACGRPVRFYDNIPVLSWLLLRGRCRACREPISPRYPVVEAATGLLCAGVLLAHDSAVGIALGILLVLVLVPLTLIDLDVKRLPNSITYPAGVAGLLIGTALDPSGEPERLIAAAAAGLFLLVVVMAYPRGMGMGDVKLIVVLGLFLGRAVAPALLVALLSGVLVGAVIMTRVGVAAGRKTKVPFGPFLALGGVVGIFAGNAIVDAYLDSFT